MDDARKEKFNGAVKKLRSFFISERFMMVLFGIAALINVFGIEVQGLLIFAFILVFLLIFCDDIVATTLPFLLLALTLIKCYDSYSVFIKYLWVAVPFVAALIFHFIFYHTKIRIGKCFWAILAVSISVSVGGVGFLPLENYTTLVGFYYIFGLGFGMLLTYVLLSTYLKAREDYSLSEKFSNIMVIMGLFAVFMIGSYYFKNIDTVAATKSIIYMQWRNNISTFFMFSMPFAFYKAVKRPSFTLIGILFYGCILLTGSRGGLIFGGIEFLMCVAILLSVDKRHRLPYIVILLGILLAIFVYFQDFYSFFGETFDRLIMGLRGNEKEVRLGLFARAFRDFKSNPFFGTGITYFGNRDVYHNTQFALCWYHCEPLQILASLGLFGVATYTYQGLTRLFIMLRRTTVFNIAVAVSYIGIEMMSLVNPGVFCPVPYLLLVTILIVVVEKCNEKGENEALYVFKGKKKTDKKAKSQSV